MSFGISFISTLTLYNCCEVAQSSARNFKTFNFPLQAHTTFSLSGFVLKFQRIVECQDFELEKKVKFKTNKYIKFPIPRLCTAV